jgi:UPF0755 protein
MADWSPRTADEREAARREREAARAHPARHRPRRPGRSPRTRRRGHSLGARIAALLAFVVVAVVIWFAFEVFQPFHGAGHGSVVVTIPAHSGASQVGDELARDGVISSGFFFNIRAALEGDRGKLRSGTYHLKLGMSYGDALKILTTPPPAAPTTEVTIAEGDTRAHIAAKLRAEHIAGDYLALTRRSPLLDPRAYGAPPTLPSLEGFLFPATYQLLEPIRVGDLVADQLKTFKQRFATVNMAYARGKHLTPFDVLTIASMVQAEAQTLHDMPLIASVIYNRLHDHMLLGIDATTRYATGNYTKPLTLSELASTSPYNTRVHRGLPLGPIDSPGLAAINAAAHPAATNYLYFVAKPCGNGASVFTASYAQFQQLAAGYQAARARRGGHSPTHC